jgi:hypothetical protein
MASSQVRVHDCFDVLAGESKPQKCNCPNYVSPQVAQELIHSGKAKFLNRRSIALLVVRNRAARVANPEVFAANETDYEFVRKFRTLLPKSKLSKGDVLDGIKNPEKFNGSDDYPVCRQLSEHYWNKVLVNCRLSILSGQFLTDAVHGRGKLISGGIDSEKIPEPEAQPEKEISGRVKAANFRKGEFNGGIISSPGSEPDELSQEGSHGDNLPTYGKLAAPVNRHKFRCDPNQAELNAYFTWNMDQIFAHILSLQIQGYSEEIIMAEIMRIVDPVFSKEAVTLICSGCGIHEKRVLHVPPDVAVQDKQSFTCKKCNGYLTDEGRRMSARKHAVLKPEVLAA